MGYRPLTDLESQGVRFKRATAFECLRMAREMRELDVAECAAFGLSPHRAILDAPGRKWIAVDFENRPLAAFGAFKNADGVGCIWLLGTDRLARHRRFLVRTAPRLVAAWKKQFGVMANAALLTNHLHIHWLRRLGAVFGEPMQHSGHTFIPFWI